VHLDLNKFTLPAEYKHNIIELRFKSVMFYVGVHNHVAFKYAGVSRDCQITKSLTLVVCVLHYYGSLLPAPNTGVVKRAGFQLCAH